MTLWAQPVSRTTTLQSSVKPILTGLRIQSWMLDATEGNGSFLPGRAVRPVVGRTFTSWRGVIAGPEARCLASHSAPHLVDDLRRTGSLAQPQRRRQPCSLSRAAKSSEG